PAKRWKAGVIRKPSAGSGRVGKRPAETWHHDPVADGRTFPFDGGEPVGGPDRDTSTARRRGSTCRKQRKASTGRVARLPVDQWLWSDGGDYIQLLSSIQGIGRYARLGADRKADRQRAGVRAG